MDLFDSIKTPKSVRQDVDAPESLVVVPHQDPTPGTHGTSCSRVPNSYYTLFGEICFEGVDMESGSFSSYSRVKGLWHEKVNEVPVPVPTAVMRKKQIYMSFYKLTSLTPPAVSMVIDIVA